MRESFEDPEAFSKLPLFAQAFAAARMLKRAILALPESDPKKPREELNRIYEEIEQCVAAGASVEESIVELSRKLRDGTRKLSINSIGECAWYAVDSTRAALAALDFPVDATVTNSAMNAMRALGQSPRLTSLQMAILLASDIDLLAFICKEEKVHQYDAITGKVVSRMTPCHALTLNEPRRSAEDEAR